jgi:hypothetical protein
VYAPFGEAEPDGSFYRANLTMDVECKKKIAEGLSFPFFLSFKNESYSQRTAALCLSELLEDEENQKEVC